MVGGLQKKTPWSSSMDVIEFVCCEFKCYKRFDPRMVCSCEALHQTWMWPQLARKRYMLKSISCVKMWVNAGRKTQNKCDRAQLQSNHARKSGTYAECCVTMKLCTTLTIPQPSAGFSWPCAHFCDGFAVMVGIPRTRNVGTCAQWGFSSGA